MAWLQLHWIAVLGVWAGVNVVLDAIGNALPAGRARSVLAAVSHLSPLSIISAVKSVGQAVIPPTAALLALLVLAPSMACTPAQDATIARIDGLAIPWTKAACELASDAPPPAGWVDVVCSATEGVELGVASAAGASTPAPASSAPGVTAPMPGAAPPVPPAPRLLAAHVSKPATVRLRMTIPAVRALAAAHPQTLSLPSGL